MRLSIIACESVGKPVGAWGAGVRWETSVSEPAQSEASAVIARGIRLAYGSRIAVADSDLTLPAGRVTAVIGPNGSGKSTLLNAMAGLIRPAAGRLEVLGAEPREVRQRVAYVLQSTKVNEMMPITVWEVVAMGRYAGRFLPLLRRRDREAVERAMGRLGIQELANRHLGELSGGQRQRVFVAQGLAQEGDLLLLDEPVTGLDLLSRDRIMEVMAEETARGVTVVHTTHDLGDASAADYVVLCGGRVVAAGAPADVLTPENLATAYGGMLAHVVGVHHHRGRTVVLDDPHHTPAGAVSREMHPHPGEESREDPPDD